MSGGAVVISRQNRLIRAFREAGAVSPESAVKPDDIGIREGWVFRRMIAYGVFQGTEEGRYYLDPKATVRFLRLRTLRIVVFLVVMVLVFVAYIQLLPR